ncbi:MAG TPA: DUF87 domain-containing protein, partial [Chloroflexota bacterium]|nr:DUF87 domain-containing protein [Chloroflexota bacterium]
MSALRVAGPRLPGRRNAPVHAGAGADGGDRGRRRDPGAGDETRLAAGARTLADLVAPAAVEVARDHVRLDGHYARTLAVTGYPRTVSPGWLAPLVNAAEPLEVSVHVHPLATGPMVRALSHRLVQLHSSRMLDARGGRLADPEREVAYEDVERLRDALQRGDERLFSVALYVLVRAPSPAALDEATARVERTLDGMLAQSRVALLEQDAGFWCCLPAADDRLLACRNLDTGSLAMTFPFCSGALTMERGVLYGVAGHSHTPVVVDSFGAELENANATIVATSGAGKSYFTKLVALRSLLVGVDCIVVDPEDEYRRICAAAAGQYVRLAATSGQHINPFDLPRDEACGDSGGTTDEDEHGAAAAPTGDGGEDGRDPLAEQVAALVGLVEMMVASPAAPLTPHERALLDRALYETYAAAGITAAAATHGRPAPLLRDLHAGLARSKDPQAAGLALRLDRFVHGSLAGLFSSPTNVALDRRLVVFNVQSLEAELRPIAIHLVTSFVWGRVRRARRRRLLVVDEAWSVLQYPEGGLFLAAMARRARKYGLGLVAISQDVADFLGSDAGRAVVSNSAVKFLMKQDGATVDLVAAAFGLSAEERRFLLAAGKGEGLLYARGARIPLRVEASPLEHQLATTAPRELAESQQPP